MVCLELHVIERAMYIIQIVFEFENYMYVHVCMHVSVIAKK